MIQVSKTDKLLREVSLLAIGRNFYHSNIANGLLRANSYEYPLLYILVMLISNFYFLYMCFNSLWEL